MASVLVVVLNWNGLPDTEACVKSLQKQTFSDFDICVIDNNSNIKPSSHPFFKRNAVILIENSANLGFAGGVNVGINYALQHNYEYVSLINNDAVAAPNWLYNLVKASNYTGSTITTGVLLNASGDTIDSTGEYFSTWGISFPGSRGRSVSDVPESTPVFGATGGGVLYKTSLFKNIGLFDEKFFLYFEDADINFRNQLAGHTAFYTKKAVIYHKGGASSNKVAGLTVFHTFKNLPLLFWKNVPTKLLPRVGVRFLLLYTLILANAIKKGSGWPALKGVVASIYYFWTSALWKRFKIQRDKKVSADYIWSILYHDLPPEQTGLRAFRKLFTGKQ